MAIFKQKYQKQRILQNHSIEQANDLYLPAQSLYPKLKEHENNTNFFSGSGSTFFTID
jgi:4-diphosphocytidyl-2-C-methyl-D-erythritol kinase